MEFIDTHTHLYLEEFELDRDRVVESAVSKGVSRMFLPNIDSSSVAGMLDLCRMHPEHCFPMMGLHPTSVKENYKEELYQVKELLEKHDTRFWAIGEIGIDLYWDKTFYDEQLLAFIYQLDLATKYRLPAVIHTRNSFDIAIQVIGDRNDASLTGVFHCFGGSVEQARRAVDHGFLLGIGGIITYKNSGLQKVVETLGPGHLVLETDAPFLTPVPHRGRRNESSYIPYIAEKIAEIVKMPVAEVAQITTGNAKRLFRLM
jgi:TatD DNase family protein